MKIMKINLRQSVKSNWNTRFLSHSFFPICMTASSAKRLFFRKI